MDADWDELARLIIPPSGLLGISSPATAIAFDDIQELLWIGNDQGRVISYHGAELSRYTSTKAHVNEGPVRAFLIHEKGIISCSSRGVHLSTRRGLSQWHIAHPQMTDLRCMAFGANSAQIVVAGIQNALLVIDVEKGQVVTQHDTTSKYTLMKKSRHICAATDDGHIHVISLTDFSVLMIWKAHSNMINDMDARNDYLVTCGFSVRQLGVPIVDPIANVYDLKSLKPLPPIPFHAGAAYVRLHPKLQTTSFVASQTGQIQVVDLMNPVNVMLKQANVQFMLGMEISSSGDALVITDSNGYVYLWGSPSKVRFNNISKETDFGNTSPPSSAHVDWHESPLNIVGMPYYSDRLLSSWPNHMVFHVGAPPSPLDTGMLTYLQPAEIGQYGPNWSRGKLHRYQADNIHAERTPTVLTAPKFLSEKAKESAGQDLDWKKSDTSDTLTASAITGRPQTDKERMLKYGNVEIKYSRFGVDDFDFHYYNKTTYSGLETHIQNSFVNSLLQLYKFVPLIRNVALHHAATACVQPNCLLCEMGFLFDMLEKAQGQNCQATNLLRAFGASREAANMNLFEDAAHASHVALSNTIQAVNRFILKQISRDYATTSGSSEGIDKLLATNALETIGCMYCRNETTKPGTLYVHELLYPTLDPKHMGRNSQLKFSSILRATIERETKNRGWCNKCRRYQQLQIRKSVQQLPQVLMLNAALASPAMRTLWETPGWLPTEIGISLHHRDVYCFEGADLTQQVRNKPGSLLVYELVGFVAEIDSSDRHQPHLVSMVNVDVSRAAPVRASSPGATAFTKDWHLFNDFLVSPVDPREAVHFNKKWKMPCVLAYQIKSAHGDIDDSWRDHLDTSLLYQSYSINGIAPTTRCTMLDLSELPRPGTAIALDTEFVELERAEIDVKADGSQETIRPAKSGLARVSVLRGEGPYENRPFIDDYITIYDTIVDYKTQYSGIKPGDLDVRVSQHNLVPLKVAYKKLWLLLNLGCRFIGHGLASDFRKANIHVPKSQTVDTQYLYLAPGKNRRFSLKYLAWAVFQEYIQEDTFEEGSIDGHDSIEDAHMALRLWRKFQESDAAGTAEQMIEEIYRKGQKFGWKPPPRSGGVIIGDGVMTPGAVASGRNTPDSVAASASRLNLSGSPAFKFNGGRALNEPSIRLKGSPHR